MKIKIVALLLGIMLISFTGYSNADRAEKSAFDDIGVIHDNDFGFNVSADLTVYSPVSGELPAVKVNNVGMLASSIEIDGGKPVSLTQDLNAPIGALAERYFRKARDGI